MLKVGLIALLGLLLQVEPSDAPVRQRACKQDAKLVELARQRANEGHRHLIPRTWPGKIVRCDPREVEINFSRPAGGLVIGHVTTWVVVEPHSGRVLRVSADQ